MPTNRREFLVLVSLSGASLLLRACAPRTQAEPLRATPWVAIHPDGSVELTVPKLEMGQGIVTALALLVAEELDVAPASLRVRVPSTLETGDHGRDLHTASSASIGRSWLPLRTAAATARELLVAAAASRWGVGADECANVGGAVEHMASGRRAAWGELLQTAAGLPVPAAPRLEPAGSWQWIGHPTPRLEGPEIVTGRARYGSDVRLPGQLFAVLARPPAPAGTLTAVDASAALALPGVHRVVAIGNAVAVVADTTWHAIRGRRSLQLEWRDGQAGRFSSRRFERHLAAALDAPLRRRYNPERPRPHAVVVRSESPSSTTGDGEPAFRAEYATPFQAHLPMEPPNATARVAEGRCEVWCGTQSPEPAVREIALALGIEREAVTLYPQAMGGAFGRKEHPGFVTEAALLARELAGRPVQVAWTRDDDVRHDLYHPPSRHRIEARLGRDGRIVAWRHRVAAPSVERQWQAPRRVIPRAEASGAWNLPYAFPELAVEYVDLKVPIALGFWRGISIGSNVFAVESAIDELAAAAGRDPLEFRLAHLGHSVTSATVETPFLVSRLRRTFELAAERAGWGEPLPPGRGRGLAGLVFDGRSACASVAEVAVDAGRLRIERLVCALDCGIVVNPLGLAGNAESALAWGLSSLFTEIRIQRGRTVQRGPQDYRVLRLPRMPAIEIHTVESDEPPSGSGEIPVPTVAPAVANAIFQATGKRLRRLPLQLGELS